MKFLQGVQEVKVYYEIGNQTRVINYDSKVLKLLKFSHETIAT